MSDQSLTEDVVDELVWDAALNADNIGVTVRDGAVTLTGYVSTYAEKRTAVSAAERVAGVRVIADEIEVRLSGSHVEGDPEIAEAIQHTLSWNTSIPETVKAEVRDAWVTLRGEVDWHFQRNESERAVRSIRGVKGVTNAITVKTKATAEDVETRVGDALKRSAYLDARSVSVTAEDGTVELTGEVHSLHEKQLAENAALSAPGVSEVRNNITVSP